VDAADDGAFAGGRASTREFLMASCKYSSSSSGLWGASRDAIPLALRVLPPPWYPRPRSAMGGELGDPIPRGSFGARPNRKTFGKEKKLCPSMEKSYWRKTGVADMGGEAWAIIFIT